jgi:hypothetical protein
MAIPMQKLDNRIDRILSMGDCSAHSPIPSSCRHRTRLFCFFLWIGRLNYARCLIRNELTIYQIGGEREREMVGR